MMQTINTYANISFKQAEADIHMNKEAKCKAAKDNIFNTQGSMMASNIGLDEIILVLFILLVLFISLRMVRLHDQS